MAAIRVRAIEYAIVPRDMADELGLSPADVKQHFADLNDLAVITCVDTRGRKLTAVGDPEDLRQKLAGDGTRQRNDMELAQSRWPVLLRGWLLAS